MPRNYLRVRRRDDATGISGKVNFVAKEGQFVNFDSTDLATPSLALVTGKQGFALMRDVVSGSVPLDNFIFPKAVVKNPEVVGSHVAASRLLEAEYEGPDLVLASGTGLINGSTAAETEVSTVNGLLRVKQVGDVAIGRIVGQLTPVDSGNAARILVQFYI